MSHTLDKPQLAVSSEPHGNWTRGCENGEGFLKETCLRGDLKGKMARISVCGEGGGEGIVKIKGSEGRELVGRSSQSSGQLDCWEGGGKRGGQGLGNQ